MKENYFDMYSYMTYVWVIGLSIWGGFANYLRKIREGHLKRFSLAELVGDLCISGFVGFITFLLCRAGDVSPEITSVFIGISGHMGSRAIFSLEKFMMDKLYGRLK